jgi:C2 domain
MGDGATLHDEFPWSFALYTCGIHASFDDPRGRMGEIVRCQVTMERLLRNRGQPDVRTSACSPFGPTVAFPGFDARTVLFLDYNRDESSLEQVCAWLQQNFITIEIHSMREKGARHSRASVRISYFDCATGAVDHTLNLRDINGKTIGKLSFSVAMQEVAEISVRMQRVKLTGLPNPDKKRSINPYLKYQYSRNWPAVHRGELKAVYSEVRHKTHNPVWEDLPVLRFRSSLTDLFRHSIQVHVTHHGKVRHIPLVHASLLFRSLVSKGHKLKEKDVIVFHGDLPKSGARIEGKLLLSGLPRFSQGLADGPGRPLHIEEGLINFKKMLPWVVAPELPIISDADSESDSSSGSRDNVDKSRRKKKPAPASDDEDDKQSSLRHTSHVRDHGSLDSYQDANGPESDNNDDAAGVPHESQAVDLGDQAGAMSLPRLNRSRSVGSMPFALDQPHHHAKHHTGALILFEEDGEPTTPSIFERALQDQRDDERIAEAAVRTGLAELVLEPSASADLDETNPFRE